MANQRTPVRNNQGETIGFYERSGEYIIAFNSLGDRFWASYETPESAIRAIHSYSNCPL